MFTELSSSDESFFIYEEISMIELKHINKTFGKYKALDDINLTIRDGEIFGVVGQSGA